MLRGKLGGAEEVTLTVWADCCGECTEKAAGLMLAEAVAAKVGLRITFKLYAACDNEPPIARSL